jgi:hypothetical protein
LVSTPKGHSMTSRLVRRSWLAAGAGILGMLAGCSPTVATIPAEKANSIACANVTVRLPNTVAGLSRRETNAQSTGAWGDPARILLRCGVAVPVASALPCVEANSIFWLQDGSSAPSYTYTSFGRDPAVAVTIDQSKVIPGTALDDLSYSVEFTPLNGHQCLGVALNESARKTRTGSASQELCVPDEQGTQIAPGPSPLTTRTSCERIHS